MHILSGLYKNRELKTPKGTKTRPTTAKIRKSLFDILQSQIEGADFLDLFAGSGSMGIEALSRGAKSATFVERDRSAIFCIRENLRALKIKGHIIQSDAASALKKLHKQNIQFDIIYLDPPYDLNISSILEQIPLLLLPEGVAILEQSKRAQLQPEPLKLIDERRFGDTTLFFLSL